MLKKKRGTNVPHGRERHLEHEVTELERRVKRLEEQIEIAFREIKALQNARHDVVSNTITQIGGTMPKQPKFKAVATVGVVAGQTGTFQTTPSPANSAYATPPVWTSDNPLAVVTPNLTLDPTGATVNVAVDPTATGSFNLSVAYTNPDGTVSTPGTLNVPVIPGPPPPPVDVTSNTIEQIA